MVNLPVDEKIAERLQALAAQKQTDVNSLLDDFLKAQDTTPDDYPSKFKTAEERRAALKAFIGAFDWPVTDLSTTVRETMAEYWKKKAKEHERGYETVNDKQQSSAD